MRYAFFGNGEPASRLIQSFYDLRRGDILYNSPDENSINRLGIQIIFIMGDDVEINIIKKDEIVNKNITIEQLEKIIWQ